MRARILTKWLNATKDGAEYLSTNKEGRVPPVTKVLMNPPFAQDKSYEPEFRFVEQALMQMSDRGTLFSVLPTSVMVKSGKELAFRKRLLLGNTLLCVITFPDDLFYPQAGTSTVGIFVKKGIPHPKNQNVLWVKMWGDGFVKKKKKRLFDPNTRNDLPKIQTIVSDFLKNHGVKIRNVPKSIKISSIDYENPEMELIPEAYLDDNEPTPKAIENGIEELIRENIAFNIKFENKLKHVK